MSDEVKEVRENNDGIAMSISALGLGIISILTHWFWYITLPTGILAIVFGVKMIRKRGSKLGKAGLVLGIIGLTLFVLIYILMISSILLDL